MRRGRRRFDDGSDFQIVDPHLGEARPGINVEHQPIDIGIGKVHVAFQLRTHDLLLLAGLLGGAAQFQPLPAAHRLVQVAA